MQTNISSSVIHRKKNDESTSIETHPAQVLKKTDNFNNQIIMSGTAKRESIKKNETYNVVKTSHESQFKGNFLKLRAPFYKSRQRQNQEGRIMTKSCELIFECIKPYKEIKIAKKTQVTESVQTIGRIWKTTDIIYRKATREVRFLSFSEENSVPSFFFKEYAITWQNPLMTLFPTESSTEDMEIQNEMNYDVLNQVGGHLPSVTDYK